MRSICAIALLSLFIVSTPTVAAAGQQEAAVAPKQRALVLSLYAANAALHGYDLYSTRTALSRGGAEANPFMSSATKHFGAFTLVKAGAATLTIVTAERLWRRKRRGPAIGLMILSNGLMSVVALHNRSVLNRLR
jgi:hypothetical protein